MQPIEKAVAAYFLKQMLLLLRVVVQQVFSRGVGGHAEVFIGPGAEVDIFAAVAAKGAVRIGWGVNAVATAGGAGHQFRCA